MKKEKVQKSEKIKKEKKNRKAININFTVLAIVLIVILCVCITPVTFQNDTFYTIKIGEVITNSGIDMMDHFSWHENLSYTYPHWLYDLITYFIYSIANFKGVYIITCILSAILGISIYFVNSKLTNNKSVSFIITIGVLYMIQSYIAARAQLITFILFIWEIYFIEQYIKNKKLINVGALVIIATLIANLHVAVWPFFFVLFLPYIAEYIIAELSDIIIYSKISIKLKELKIKRLNKKKPEKAQKLIEELELLKSQVSRIKIKREEENKNPYKIIIKKNKNVRYLIIIMIICIFTGLLTPLGDTPYTYLYKTMQGNTTENISEHLPMTITQNTDVMCTLVVFLSILIFTKTKIKLSDLFMTVGLCYLMLSTRRQQSMFVLICSVTLTRLVINMIKIYTKNGIEEAEKVTKHLGVAIVLVILFIELSVTSIKPKLDDKFVSESSYPVAACDYILENIDISNAKFYNEYNYGSYMLFRGIPVFIDSRADLYAPEFSGDKERDIFTDFINTSSVSRFYEDTFEKYDITHVICYKKSKTNLVITKTKDKNYKELYSDDNFVIYERLNVEK